MVAPHRPKRSLHPAKPSPARQLFIDHESAKRGYDAWFNKVCADAQVAAEKARRAHIEHHAAEQKRRSAEVRAPNDAIIAMMRESIPRVMRILGGPAGLKRLRELADGDVEASEDEVNAWQVCEAVMRDLGFGEITEAQEKQFRLLFDQACRLLDSEMEA